jgi:hypothetical protein
MLARHGFPSGVALPGQQARGIERRQGEFTLFHGADSGSVSRPFTTPR